MGLVSESHGEISDISTNARTLVLLNSLGFNLRFWKLAKGDLKEFASGTSHILRADLKCHFARRSRCRKIRSSFLNDISIHTQSNSRHAVILELARKKTRSPRELDPAHWGQVGLGGLDQNFSKNEFVCSETPFSTFWEFSTHGNQYFSIKCH